jgi:5-methyltetrahydrofolate--homocysteine methyltransferase
MNSPDHDLLNTLAENLVQGYADRVRRLTSEALEAGIAPQRILEEGLLAGMNVVGKRFKNNEMFLPEVLVAARAMKSGVLELEPLLIASGVQPVGRFVIGTVKGDLHDIGKNLVSIMLRGAGFDVRDLGVGVSAQKFVDEIKTYEPHIVGMSAMLTTTMLQMKTNIAIFREAGILGCAKVMIGGAPVSRSYAEEIGADAYGRNASDAVEKAQELMRAIEGESATRMAVPDYRP